MLDIKRIRENPDAIKKGLKKRSVEGSAIDEIVELDMQRRSLLREVESLQHEKTNNPQNWFHGKKGEDISGLRSEMKMVAEKITDGTERLRIVDEQIFNHLLNYPIFPMDSVPYGEDAEDNPVIKTWGNIPTFTFDPLSHVELGEKLQWIDFERGVKLAGNKYSLLRGTGAKLARKLQSLMLDNGQ